MQSSFAVLIDGTLNLRAHVHKLGVVAGIRTRISSLTWNFEYADCILNRITFISVLPLDDNDKIGGGLLGPWNPSPREYVHRNLVQPVGIEPTSSVLQTGAMTTSAKVAYLVVPTRFELVTFTMSTYCSTTELRN